MSERVWGMVREDYSQYAIGGERGAINPDREGTKCAAQYKLEVLAGETVTVRLRLARTLHARPFDELATVFEQRLAEADEFYPSVQPDDLGDDERSVQRQASAGKLWSKQLYYFDIEQWLRGDPSLPKPPQSRQRGRNYDWAHRTRQVGRVS